MNKLYRLIRYDLPVHFLLLFTNWLPDNVPFLIFRGAIVSKFLGSCGRNLQLGRDVSFYNPSKIHIGEDVYIGHGSRFIADELIELQDQVLLGPYCIVASSNHTRLGNSYRFGIPKQSPITIGKGSWLAAHVTVTAGSRIGPGTLVAAGAVTRGELPPNTVVGGIPASVIKVLTDSYPEADEG